jgi:hypothetical protein
LTDSDINKALLAAEAAIKEAVAVHGKLEFYVTALRAAGNESEASKWEGKAQAVRQSLPSGAMEEYLAKQAAPDNAATKAGFVPTLSGVFVLDNTATLDGSAPLPFAPTLETPTEKVSQPADAFSPTASGVFVLDPTLMSDSQVNKAIAVTSEQSATSAQGSGTGVPDPFKPSASGVFSLDALKDLDEAEALNHIVAASTGECSKPDVKSKPAPTPSVAEGFSPSASGVFILDASLTEGNDDKKEED